MLGKVKLFFGIEGLKVDLDVFVAGCPPRPEALIHGVLTVYEKVKGEKFKDLAVK